VDGGLVVFVSVRVNLSIKTQAVEELQEQKKSLHTVSARSMAAEVKFELTELKNPHHHQFPQSLNSPTKGANIFTDSLQIRHTSCVRSSTLPELRNHSTKKWRHTHGLEFKLLFSPMAKLIMALMRSGDL
jgi:hypothetical protein